METIKNAAVIVGLLAAMWGLYRGVIEYRLQGAQKRADFFLKKQSEFFANESFAEIRDLLGKDAAELRSIAFERKRAYLTFFEEIALLKNSRLIQEDVAFYMFGYYAVECYESKNFWSNINRKEIFWGVFLAFASVMQRRLRTDGEIVPPDLKF